MSLELAKAQASAASGTPLPSNFGLSAEVGQIPQLSGQFDAPHPARFPIPIPAAGIAAGVAPWRLCSALTAVVLAVPAGWGAAPWWPALWWLALWWLALSGVPAHPVSLARSAPS